MNQDLTPAKSETESAKPAPLSSLEDDLDFSDVQLKPRPANANQEIVCEGGCE